MVRRRIIFHCVQEKRHSFWRSCWGRLDTVVGIRSSKPYNITSYAAVCGGVWYSTHQHDRLRCWSDGTLGSVRLLSSSSVTTVVLNVANPNMTIES
jgi:hypothetical protein